MNRRIVALMVALLSALLAVDARADLLLAVDGVELHGTVELLRSGASTCNVRESDTAYENRKANHGAPMDLWRVNMEVHNRTGRWLNHVVARYTIDSEWPACSNWDHPEGVSLVEIVHWFDLFRFIQESGRNVMAPGAVLTAETEHLIVLRGDSAWRTFDTVV